MKFTRVVLVAIISTCSLVAVSQPVHAAAEPTFVVDPNLTATDQTYATQIRTAISKAATEYGYTGFTAVIYAPTSEGAATFSAKREGSSAISSSHFQWELPIHSQPKPAGCANVRMDSKP
jgi:hypothetical protein